LRRLAGTVLHRKGFSEAVSGAGQKARRAGHAGATITSVPLFDYDIVSTRAAYRSCLPRNLPVLLALVERRAARLKADPAAARAAAELTVSQLARHKAGGAILLVEVEQDAVGYCIISLSWSHRLGGTVLRVEELYVDAGHDGQAIAADLLEMLAKIAPGGAVAIRVEPGVADRKLRAALLGAGFRSEADPGMERDMRRSIP
jgi:hypothetical protein